jgi:hypothetical protein
LLIGNAVSVGVPEIAATGLDALSLLITKDGLHDVLVSVLAGFLEFILDAVGDVLAERVQVAGRGLLFWDQFVLEDGLDDFSGFGGFEFLSVFGFDLVLVDAGV